MLDECKGEKFEEVMSAFAMTVLRRTARAKNDARLELALSDHLSGQQQAQLLPLIIALRRSLQQQFSQRRKIQGQAEVYAGLLAQHQASIKNRRALLSRLPMLEDRLKATGPEDIADAWVGDDRWAENMSVWPYTVRRSAPHGPVRGRLGGCSGREECQYGPPDGLTGGS